MNKRFIAISTVVLLCLVFIGLMASDRDEFPNRRQGGGSRASLPSKCDVKPKRCQFPGSLV